MVRLLNLALVVASALTSANAKGINCQGSGACGLVFLTENAADILTNYLSGVDDHRWYNNGDLIACASVKASLEAGEIPICAFFQNSGGGDGARVKKLAGYIPGHGCKECGSVPYWYPEGNNNVADGELTYNVVSNPESRCPGFPGRC